MKISPASVVMLDNDPVFFETEDEIDEKEESFAFYCVNNNNIANHEVTPDEGNVENDLEIDPQDYIHRTVEMNIKEDVELPYEPLKLSIQMQKKIHTMIKPMLQQISTEKYQKIDVMNNIEDKVENKSIEQETFIKTHKNTEIQAPIKIAPILPAIDYKQINDKKSPQIPTESKDSKKNSANSVFVKKEMIKETENIKKTSPNIKIEKITTQKQQNNFQEGTMSSQESYKNLSHTEQFDAHSTFYKHEVISEVKNIINVPSICYIQNNILTIIVSPVIVLTQTQQDHIKHIAAKYNLTLVMQKRKN